MEQPGTKSKPRSRWSRIFQSNPDDALVRRQRGEYKNKIRQKEWSDEEGGPLHFAAKHGHLALLSKLLTLPGAAITVDAKSHNGFTPLELAIEHHRFEAMDKLLHNGSRIDGEALYFAALHPDLRPLNHLLTRLRSSSSEASTPISNIDNLLRTAILRGHIGLVNYLLDAGADLRCGTSSALHIAVECDAADILKRLMEQPNVLYALNITDADSLTPLQAAIASNERQSAKILLTSPTCQLPINTCQEALRFLFLPGPETAEVSLSALATPGSQPFKLKYNRTTVGEILPVLVAQGAKVDDVVFEGRNLLQQAVFENNAPLAVLCLENGSRPNVVDRQGRTPLFDAVIHTSNPLLTNLLKHGANPDVPDDQGDTVLFVAIRRRSTSMVTPLLDVSQDADMRNKKGQSIISLATEYGDLPMLIAILKKSKAHLSAQDENQDTPLLLACKSGNLHIALALIKAGAYCSDKDRNGRNALHILLSGDVTEDRGKDRGILETMLLPEIPRGRAAVIKAVIDGGINLDEKDMSGKTALHYAASQGNIEAIKVLVEGGASLEEKDALLLTPLYAAATCQKVDAVEALLDSGARAAPTNLKDETPLHQAVVLGNTEIVTTLLRDNAGIDHRDFKGNSALHYATINERIEMIAALISGGADVNQKNSKGETPLSHAASKGSVEMAELLLNAGAATDTSDGTPGFPSYLTPLQLAVDEDKKEVADVLLDWSIRTSDPTVGRDLFLLAVVKGNVTVMLKLIKNGLDPNTEVSEGQTALHIAIKKGDTDLALALLEHGASANDPESMPSLLFLATQKGMTQVVRTLISKSDGPEASRVQLRAALRSAISAANEDLTLLLLQSKCAATNNIEKDASLLAEATTKAMPRVVEALLSKGANPNSSGQGGMGDLPLHITVNQGNFEISCLLLEHGAKPCLKSANSYTPLQIAVAGNHDKIANKLMECGEKPYEQSLENGVTLLQVALSKENHALIMALLQHGGLDAEITTGDTPLQMAVASGNIDVVKEMNKHGASVRPNSNTTTVSLIKLAVAKGHANMTKCLFELGATCTDEWYGDTALQLAVARGSHEIAAIILRFTKANRHYMDRRLSDGTTLLQIAISREDDEMAEILLRNGARGGSGDETQGNTPLQIAVAKGKVDIARKLMDNGDDPNKNVLEDGTTLMQIAVSRNDAPMVLALIYKDAFRGGRKDGLKGPFTMALTRDMPEILDHLLIPNKQGQRPSPDLLVTPKGELTGSSLLSGDDLTALMFAALVDSPGLVKVLISHNARVDLCDAEGRTALQLAVLNGSPRMIEVVDELIKGGADPTRVDRTNGANAVHIAILKKNMVLLERLFVSKITFLQFFDHKEKSTGLTALELARRTGFHEAVKHIEYYGYFMKGGFTTSGL